MPPAPPPTSPHTPLFCPHCSYDLRAIQSTRCPECGWTIDPDAFLIQLPWAHRKRIGHFRAFLKTLLWTLFHPWRLAEQSKYPLSYSDARKFQLLVLFLASLAPAGFSIYWHWNDNWPAAAERILKEIPAIPLLRDDRFTLARTLTAHGSFAAAFVSIAIFLLLATGLPSYFFHPKRLPLPRQNSAVAVSYYACGPLVLWLLTALLLPLAIGITPLIDRFDRSLAFNADSYWFLHLIPILGSMLDTEILAYILLIIPALWSLWTTLVLFRHSTGASIRMCILFAFALPLLWALLLNTIFYSFTLTAEYLVLVLRSLS